MNKWHNRYINLAKEISTWSLDPSTKIGAVAIGNKGQILSCGYNGLPRNISDTEDRLNDRNIKYSLMVHAEMNCIYNATLNGISLNGSKIYVYGLPVCSECAKGIIQVGISEVFWYVDKEIPEKWLNSFELTVSLLNEANIKIERI